MDLPLNKLNYIFAEFSEAALNSHSTVQGLLNLVLEYANILDMFLKIIPLWSKECMSLAVAMIDDQKSA